MTKLITQEVLPTAAKLACPAQRQRKLLYDVGGRNAGLAAEPADDVATHPFLRSQEQPATPQGVPYALFALPATGPKPYGR